MEQVLSAGQAEFISMSRPFINDPEFPNKLRGWHAGTLRLSFGEQLLAKTGR